MHIPSEMLSGAVCPVTAALSAAGAGAAAALILRRKNLAPKAANFALTGAVVFALQMLNYPVWNGISGHVIGGVFASAMLGVPGGVLCTALVLLVQTLLFADGGLLMLGANVFNMAIVGAGVGGLLLAQLQKRGVSRAVSVFAAGAVSVELAAAALGAELLASGSAPLSAVATLLGVHAALAVAEGAATLGLLLLARGNADGRELSRKGTAALGSVLIAALAAAPFASAFPDAFEWTMERFSLLPSAPNFARAPFADYAVPAVADATLSALIAGTLGAAAVLALGFCLCAALRARRAKGSA